MKAKWLYHGRFVTVDPKMFTKELIDPSRRDTYGNKLCAVCNESIRFEHYFHGICYKHSVIPDLDTQGEHFNFTEVNRRALLDALSIIERGGGPEGIYYEYHPDLAGHPPLRDDEASIGISAAFLDGSVGLLVAMVIERLSNIVIKKHEHSHENS